MLRPVPLRRILPARDPIALFPENGTICQSPVDWMMRYLAGEAATPELEHLCAGAVIWQAKRQREYSAIRSLAFRRSGYVW